MEREGTIVRRKDSCRGKTPSALMGKLKLVLVTFAVLRSPLMVKLWGVNDLASDDSRLHVLTIGARK